MQNKLNGLLNEAKSLFFQAKFSAELENTKSVFLGKNGKITEMLKNLAKLSIEEKKKLGGLINKTKQEIKNLLNQRRQELADEQLQKKLKEQELDVSLPGRINLKGGLHPASLTIERIENIFHSMGFEVADGPEIENDWFNFTALNTPENHPARSMHDTFYIENEKDNQQENLVLRTHTSPMQIRHARKHVKKYQNLLDKNEIMPDIRVIAPGRTYRVDSDATHSPMFHQCEGLWIGTNITFKDLKFIFTNFCKTFFELEDLKLRFRPSFFPFTEPSAEVDIQFPEGPLANQWLEIAGSGQVHPQVVRNMGLNPEKYLGFAFGIGPDRLTMLRYGIKDLRLFFDSDLRFLSQFK